MLSKLHDMHFGGGVGEVAAAEVCALQSLHETCHKLVQEVDLEGWETRDKVVGE